jgi:hypothetical protein
LQRKLGQATADGGFFAFTGGHDQESRLFVPLAGICGVKCILDHSYRQKQAD